MDVVSLTERYLIERRWKFFHRDGPVASHNFRFLPDGTIGGYDNPNERRWRLEDGVLVVMNADGGPTLRLTTVTKTVDGLILWGAHIPDPEVLLCLVELGSDWPSIPGTKAAFAREVRLLGWEIGEHTYGVPECLETGGRAKLIIGKFTSIADSVTIVLADHRMDSVSTYPFVALNQYWPSAQGMKRAEDHVSKGDVRIGNDVWVGSGAFITSGVTIGDGAVIGARAVVTKNVPPYAVVVGNPGQVKHKRFSDDIIDELLSLRWWDWASEKIDQYLPLMMAGDIGKFLEAAKFPNHDLRSPV